MTRLRKRVAERLHPVAVDCGHAHHFQRGGHGGGDGRAQRYQDELREARRKLGFMSFFIKAVIAALSRFPSRERTAGRRRHRQSRLLRHRYRGGQPRAWWYRWCATLISSRLADIEGDHGIRTGRATGKFTLDEMTGGTFTISNGGVFGSMLSTPIINPPQSAILGMHNTKERPVAVNGQVVIRPMMYLALSYDHRIIDGREAVLRWSRSRKRWKIQPVCCSRLTARNGTAKAQRRRKESLGRVPGMFCFCAPGLICALALRLTVEVLAMSSVRRRSDRRRPGRLRGCHPRRPARPRDRLHRRLEQPKGAAQPRRNLPQRRLHSVQGAAGIVREL